MKNQKLNNCRVAILSTDGFEQSELTQPLEALREAGAQVKVVSPKTGSIRGWNEKDWGDSVPVDVQLDRAQPDDFDALVLPGGVMNPDSLRSNAAAVSFVQSFVSAGKPIAAICHGPQTLIETGMVRGRKLTSYQSLRTDLINAGAQWVDEPVVSDMGLVTSRKPADLPQFCAKMIEEFAEGRHPEHGRERTASRKGSSGVQL